MLFTFIYIGDLGGLRFLLYRFHEERRTLVGNRPEETLAFQVFQLAHTATHQLVVAIIDHNLGVAEKLQLLFTLRFLAAEVLLMGVSEVRQHGNGGLNDVMQGRHLAHLTDAGFENAHLCVLVQQPNTKRNAYLRVVTAGRTRHKQVVTQQLIEPFLHHCLAITARNADYRYVEFVTMSLSQALKCLQCVDHLQEVGIGIVGLAIERHLRHHEIPYTTTI